MISDAALLPINPSFDDNSVQRFPCALSSPRIIFLGDHLINGFLLWHMVDGRLGGDHFCVFNYYRRRDSWSAADGNWGTIICRWIVWAPSEIILHMRMTETKRSVKITKIKLILKVICLNFRFLENFNDDSNSISKLLVVPIEGRACSNIPNDRWDGKRAAIKLKPSINKELINHHHLLRCSNATLELGSCMIRILISHREARFPTRDGVQVLRNSN